MLLEIELSSAAVAGFKVPLLAVAMDDKPGAASLADLDASLGGSLQRATESHEFRGSRDEILQSVWGGQHDTDSNDIEVFVCHLRNKIGDKDNQTIRTIRGVGYFFART